MQTQQTTKPREVIARRNGYELSTDGVFYYVTRAGTGFYVCVARSMTEAAKYLASC